MVTAAMLDRLLQRAVVLGIDGPSYRLRRARREWGPVDTLEWNKVTHRVHKSHNVPLVGGVSGSGDRLYA